ncbi:serine protease [Serratia rhizosphaerae]
MRYSSVDFYPHLPVTTLAPSWIQQNATTRLSEKWQKALVSFFVRKAHSVKEAQLIGSGFLYMLGGVQPCIFTASHVVNELLQGDTPFFSINGEKFRFRNLEYYHNEQQDYAVIPFSQEMLAAERGYTLFRGEERALLRKTSSFVIMGYPSNRNRLHVDRNNDGLYLQNITFHHFSYDTDSEDIYFAFDPKAKKSGFTYEQASSRTSLSSLAGMSGSVIAQIMEHQITGDFTLRAVGIFKEQPKKRQGKDKFLVGCTLIQFADEVNDLIRLRTIMRSEA